MQKKVRVLVADDSPIVRDILVDALGRAGDLEVVGTAESGDEAAALTAKLRPDVITMDLQMPGSDGFAGIARIMAENPTPILVLSADREEVKGFRALSLGALDLLEKPPLEKLDGFAKELASRLRLLATVPVIRHPWGLRERTPLPPRPRTARPRVVVLGASIGGPGALAQILRGLPANFPTPIALVQHMADGFTTAFTRWLGQELALRVREAEEGMELEPGTVYVAPDDHHLRIRDGRVSLGTDEPQHGFRPSVSALFHSAAACYGARSVGVLLTGMGMDGADGLAAIRQAGGLTIAQDEATSAVFGMPRAAIEIGAAERVLPLGAISDAIREALR
ncbi:MAG TPA: chemotaxis protein CheB [Fredinandcohnia sp.]|nr:chemotaxis protein CheB [Fredinandcohnia sp.]